jgi:calcium-dependent protein kinase
LRSSQDSAPSDLVIERRRFLFHHSCTDGERLEDQYELHHDIIGQGRFSQVFLATHKTTGDKRAIKTLRKSEVAPQAFWKEIQVLKTIDHPNVLRLFESFEDASNYYIVTEVATQGTLYQYFKSHINELTEADLALLLRQILTCLNHCHAHDVIHCDLKLENVLLDADDAMLSVILCDFGFSQFYHDESKLRRGTPPYIAPEVLRGNRFGPKCDIWALGVLAFILLIGDVPFKGEQELYHQMEFQTDHFGLELWNNVSPLGKAFVQTLLQFDEANRPTAKEALNHPWFDTIIESSQSSTDTKPSSSCWQHNLGQFSAQQKLKQATYAYLVAQLTFKSSKKVIDDIFREVDTNRNGRLGRDEIVSAMQKKLSLPALENIFGNVDIDQNGCIDYWEFLAATMNSSTMLCTSNLKLAFDAFDKNRNNSISADDLKEMLCGQE